MTHGYKLADGSTHESITTLTQSAPNPTKAASQCVKGTMHSGQAADGDLTGLLPGLVNHQIAGMQQSRATQTGDDGHTTTRAPSSLRAVPGWHAGPLTRCTIHHCQVARRQGPQDRRPSQSAPEIPETQRVRPRQ